MKLVSMIITIAVAMGMACSQVSDNLALPVNDVEEIESAYYSNYPEEGEITKKITSRQEFDIEWDKTHEGMSPTPELPIVDFEERDVILLMLETKPTGGYGIDHYEILTNSDQFIIRFAESHPGEQCGTTQALTRPYKFISIPKSDKEIVFQKGKTVFHNCGA